MPAVLALHLGGRSGHQLSESKGLHSPHTGAMKRQSWAVAVLTIVGALVVAALLLRGGVTIYQNATKDERQMEDARTSCAAAVVLRGGTADDLTAQQAGMQGDLPSFRVEGGRLKSQPVYCLSYVQPTDGKVSPSAVFYLNGTNVDRA